MPATIEAVYEDWVPAEARDETVLVPSAGVGIITDAAKKPSA